MLILVLVFAVVGCTQANSNDNISSKVVTVGDLLGDPSSYEGQIVTVEGEIVSVCLSDGWFFDLKDGKVTIKIDLKETDIRVSQEQVGKSVVVYGEFMSTGGKPYIEASEVELWYS